MKRKKSHGKLAEAIESALDLAEMSGAKMTVTLTYEKPKSRGAVVEVSLPKHSTEDLRGVPEGKKPLPAGAKVRQ